MPCRKLLAVELLGFMKVCEVSSTQTITPPYRTHIKLVVQSFLRGLGTLACIAFLKYLHTLIKNTQFICHNSLVFCKLLKYYVMVLTVTSLFNKGKSVLYTRLVAQWDGTGFWLELHSNFPELQLFIVDFSCIRTFCVAYAIQKCICTDYLSQWVSFRSGLQSLTVGYHLFMLYSI